MTHDEEYKGRTIHVSVREVKRHTYKWDYTIGPDMIFEHMKDHPVPSEQIALGEALHDAKWRIDHMPPLPAKPLGT